MVSFLPLPYDSWDQTEVIKLLAVTLPTEPCWEPTNSLFCCVIFKSILKTDNLTFFMVYLFLSYVYWCFTCMYACMKVLEPLELEIQTGEPPRGCWKLNSGPPERQPML